MNSTFISIAFSMMVLAPFAGTREFNMADRGYTELRYDEVLGGVTNIREVVNQTSSNIEVIKLETPWGGAGPNTETTGTIPVRGIYSGSMWIPWANSANEFSEHQMLIKVNGRIAAYVWQTGEYVRSINSGERFSINAALAPGFSRAGGERRLVFYTQNNRLLFRFEQY